MKVMGILNVTEDSFSDGGRYRSLDNALYAVRQMIDDGADIIDIGGQSTRPGFQVIGDEAEQERVLPVIEAIKERFPVPLSIDTFQPGVLAAAIEAGIDMINDVCGLQSQDAYVRLVKDCGLPYIMTHNSREVLHLESIGDFLPFARADVLRAESAGISRDRIIYDPGIGFGKDQRSNMLLLSNANRLQELGLPILIGASKKSVIGYATGLELDQRSEATLAITGAALFAGVSIIRVHDVAGNVRFIRMLKALNDYRE